MDHDTRATPAKQRTHAKGTVRVAHAKMNEEIMPTKTVKEEAEQLVRDLPEDATWDDLMQKIYARQAIQSGLEDSEAGRTMDVKEVRKKFGLAP